MHNKKDFLLYEEKMQQHTEILRYEVFLLFVLSLNNGDPIKAFVVSLFSMRLKPCSKMKRMNPYNCQNLRKVLLNARATTY